MSRPPKQGLDYFPHDTDASNDEKVESLRSLYGNDGYAFYFIMLERIYRTPNVELDVSDAETMQIFANKVGISLELFEKILATALKRGLFDQQEYKTRVVLTSDGIKRRASIVLDKRQAMKQRYGQRGVSDAETKQKPHKANVHPLFDQFWQAYPKKKSKGEAERRFEKIKPNEALLATMLAAIEQAKKSKDWQKEAGQFIPNPATWLNAHGWEDELTEIANKPLTDHQRQIREAQEGRGDA